MRERETGCLTPAEQRRLRKDNPGRAVLEQRGWYHSFRFADGTELAGLIPLDWLEYRWRMFPLPADLSGARVLDIGTWDGWFSFEAERRGAQVTAIDTIEQPTFRTVQRKLESHVDYRMVDLFELPQAGLGQFDYVFFLGVLYHTKHPVLALEIVCAATAQMAIVESYVTDAETWREHRDEIPALEYYETDELGGQLDNWFGPTVECLMAMSRTAGFARVDVLHVERNRAALACYRQWGDEPGGAGWRANLQKVTNGIRRGINFRSSRDEYMAWYFEADGEALGRNDLRLQVGPFGVGALQLMRVDGGLWLATSRLPPGLGAGWHEARMRIGGGEWSDPRRVAVDVDARAEWIRIETVCDGRTWERNLIRTMPGAAVVSLWISGLGDNADEGNTAVFLGEERATVTYVGGAETGGMRQVNAEIAEQIPPGAYEMRVVYGGAESGAVAVQLEEES